MHGGEGRHSAATLGELDVDRVLAVHHTLGDLAVEAEWSRRCLKRFKAVCCSFCGPLLFEACLPLLFEAAVNAYNLYLPSWDGPACLAPAV